MIFNARSFTPSLHPERIYAGYPSIVSVKNMSNLLVKRYATGEWKGGLGRFSRGSWTYPTVPRVPKISHSDIKADAESEGPGEDGGHVDTCVLRGQNEKGVKGWMIEEECSLFRLTTAL